MANQASNPRWKELISRFSAQADSDFHSGTVGTQLTARIGASGRHMAAGLYLMHGATGSGKSTLGLALAMMLGENDKVVNYAALLEPRAPHGPIVMKPKLNDVIGYLEDKVLKFARRYVVLDSLTHLIPLAGKFVLQKMEDTTLQGGLRRSEILGVLTIDDIARTAGKTLIGIVNADLFPRARVLEGVCEGQIAIDPRFGDLHIRDRIAREVTSVTLDPVAISAARHVLGYPVDDDSGPGALRSGPLSIV